jgi:hypothetical protein
MRFAHEEPLLGMFHAMVPGSLIGMYGGMFFGANPHAQRRGASVCQPLAIRLLVKAWPER